MTQNTLVLLKSNEMETVLIEFFLPLSVENSATDMQYAHFVLYVLEKQLSDFMIDKQEVAQEVSVDFELYKSYIDVSVEVTLSLAGRMNLQSILDNYHEVVGKLGMVLTKETYGVVQKWIETAYILQDSTNDMFTLSSTLVSKLFTYGLDRLFKGNSLLEVAFDQQKINSFYEGVKGAKFICTVIGNFPKWKYKPKHPGPYYEDMNKPKPKAELSDRYRLDRLLNERLLKYEFLGEAGKSRAKSVELSYTDPDHGMVYGYMGLPDEYSKAVIGYMEFKLNGFTISEENLKKNASPPEGDYREIFDLPSTSVIKNTKYSLPNVILILSFHLKAFSKSSDLELAILDLALNMRLRTLNQQLSIYHSSVSFSHSPAKGKLSIFLDCVVDNLEPVFAQLIEKVFQAPLISPKEKKSALDIYYKSLMSNDAVYTEGFGAFSDWLYKSRTFSLNDTVKFMRETKDNKLDLGILNWGKNWKISSVYAEGHLDESTFGRIKEGLLLKIDPSYNPERKNESERAEPSIEFFENPQEVSEAEKDPEVWTKIVNFEKSDPESINEFYGHFFKYGDISDYKTSAEVLILSKIMHDFAFEYLRTA